MDQHERPVITENNKVGVRAGATGFGVRYMLLGGIALVVVAFIVVALFVK